MNPGLAFDDVTCLRGGRILFEGLGFALGPGEAALVLGPNGVGKSSMIRIAAGLLAPRGGRVSGDGARALLSDATALDAERTLSAALAFWAGLDRRRTALAEALDAVGMAELAEVPVRLLSTGQRRRAAFARVLASGAPVWLLDEPGNGLDSASVAMLEARIAAHRAGGGIVLVATHQPIALPGAQEIWL